MSRRAQNLKSAAELAEQLTSFRFCSPDADPIKQSSVALGYRDLARRFLWHAGRVGDQELVAACSEIETDIADHVGAAVDLNHALIPATELVRELVRAQTAEREGFRAKVSRRTRSEFREALVESTLREIDILFEGAEISRTLLAADQLPGGQRRDRVEEYYASVDWGSNVDVRRVLNVYGEVLGFHTLPEDKRQKLIGLLHQDGYEYVGGQVRPVSSHPMRTSRELPGWKVYAQHVARLEGAIEDDPPLAVGESKDLVESVARSILGQAGIEVERSVKLPALTKQVLKHLDLASDSVHASKRGAEHITRVLASLAQVIAGTAELRNLYGTGHGRSQNAGLQARHARLVVGAATTVCRFLLDTWEDRQESGTSSE